MTMCLASLCVLIFSDVLHGDEVQDDVAKAPPKHGEFSVTMGAAGVNRYVLHRWGVVKGQVANLSDHAATCLVVVTPEDSGGMQFARRISLPARTVFDAVWPVRISRVSSGGGVEFQCLFFPGGEDDGVIRHSEGSKEIPSFSGITQRNGLSLCGVIGESGPVQKSESALYQMLTALRYTSFGSPGLTLIHPSALTSGSECLDAVNQLAISDSQLLQYPLAIESIRLWVQRGGRLMILVERTGVEVAEALLGESLPMTKIGDASTNSVTLDLNEDYSKQQYPTRSVTREFPEPIRYVRVLPSIGETIWSVDGWPVAFHAPMGSGAVLVTTISTDVFIEPAQNRADDTAPTHQLIASSRRMLETLFTRRNPPLISEVTAADAAAAMIGYQIPSQTIAMMLLLIFPVSLLAAGIFLQRRSLGERLVLVLPGLAVLAAVPALAFGFQIRSVAPVTMIETTVIQSSPSSTDLPADGYATTFVPTSTDLRISSDEGDRMGVLEDPTNRDFRKLVWNSPSEVSWVNLRQSAGLRTYPLQATRTLKSALRVLVTFGENGLEGRIQTDGQLIPSDPVIAGINQEMLAVNMTSGQEFRCDASDSLAPGQFFRTTFLSDTQLFRARLLEKVFFDTTIDRSDPFPTVPTLLCWDESDSTLQFLNEGVRRQRSALVVLPLELYPPETEKRITIPPAMLSYRSIVTDKGGMSSGFSNVKRKWLPQESASEALLEFRIPGVCLPFMAESAEVELRIRAASRVVTILTGPREDLHQISELRSPLGTQTITLPTDRIQSTCLGGKLYLQINVSELDAAMKADDLTTGEQDDSWQIERVRLLLKGHRKP